MSNKLRLRGVMYPDSKQIKEQEERNKNFLYKLYHEKIMMSIEDVFLRKAVITENFYKLIFNDTEIFSIDYIKETNIDELLQMFNFTYNQQGCEFRDMFFKLYATHYKTILENIDENN